MGRRLSEDELQRAMDFFGNLLAPVSPDEYRAAGRILAARLKGQATSEPDPETSNLRFLDVHAPVIDPRIIEKVARGQHGPPPVASNTDFQSKARDTMVDLEHGELDIRPVLEKVNAMRAVRADQRNGVHNFEDEPLGRSSTGGGWVARLEKGKLGLVPADAS